MMNCHRTSVDIMVRRAKDTQSINKHYRDRLEKVLAEFAPDEKRETLEPPTIPYSAEHLLETVENLRDMVDRLLPHSTEAVAWTIRHSAEWIAATAVVRSAKELQAHPPVMQTMSLGFEGVGSQPLPEAAE